MNIQKMIRVDNENTQQTTITGECVVLGDVYSVTVPTSGLEKWLNGERVQNALPLISAEDREFLISGISPNGWNQLFEGEE